MVRKAMTGGTLAVVAGVIYGCMAGTGSDEASYSPAENNFIQQHLDTPPPLSVNANGGTCGNGNGECSGNESCSNCPQDRDACNRCGNGQCSSSENCTTCPEDCGVCPCTHDVCTIGAPLAVTCDPCVSEICFIEPFCCTVEWNDFCVSLTDLFCSPPCSCGNGTCDPGENAFNCLEDCFCGSGACDPGEDALTCPEDCFCGSGICDPGEDTLTCPGDCPCPRFTLASSVPQMITDSTVGLGNLLVPSCVVASESPEATYSFTAPAGGTYEFNTFGSSFDTVLYVLDQSCAGSELACNDDALDLASQVFVTLTAEQTVIVVVEGWGGGAGDFTLNINLSP